MAKTGAERIVAERARQIGKLGWTAEHDDEHTDGSLALAAVCYAAAAVEERVFRHETYAACESFVDPWPESWDRYHDARPYNGNVLIAPTRAQAIRLLEKAGALIAAEIDRLLRARPSREGDGRAGSPAQDEKGAAADATKGGTGAP